MLRSFVRVSVVIVVPFLAGAVLAAEGRTPVFAPGALLGADGKYIVTRNLVGGAGSVITIGAPNVDLDLNGFLLTGGGGGPVISILGGVDHVTIHNGVLSGGTIGIDFPGGPVARKIDIEDVKIHNPTTQGIHLGNVEGAALRRNEITDTGSEGILWDGPAAVKHGTIEGNLLRRTSAGIVVNNCSSVAILSNRLEEPLVGGGAFPGFGIVVGSCGGSLVSENTVERAGADGIFLRTCKGNKVFDNVVRTSAGNGIHIDSGSSDTLILNNVSSGNGTGGLPTGGEGLLVEGTQNLIERNTLNSNAGFGLRFCFAGASCANTFGRNMARGNGGAALAPCAACGGVPALFPPQSCNIAGCAVPNSTYGDNLIPGPPIF